MVLSPRSSCGRLFAEQFFDVHQFICLYFGTVFAPDERPNSDKLVQVLGGQ